MTYQIVIEGLAIASVTFGMAKVIARQYHQLKRVERGVRLVNYIVDRANEREAAASMTPSQQHRWSA